MNFTNPEPKTINKLQAVSLILQRERERERERER